MLDAIPLIKDSKWLVGNDGISKSDFVKREKNCNNYIRKNDKYYCYESKIIWHGFKQQLLCNGVREICFVGQNHRSSLLHSSNSIDYEKSIYHGDDGSIKVLAYYPGVKKPEDITEEWKIWPDAKLKRFIENINNAIKRYNIVGSNRYVELVENWDPTIEEYKEKYILFDDGWLYGREEHIENLKMISDSEFKEWLFKMIIKVNGD